MTALVAVLTALAVWLAVPDPGLARLRADRVAAPSTRRRSAWPWRWRLLAGFAAALVTWFLAPTAWWLPLPAAVLAAWGLGLAPRPAEVDASSRELPEALGFLAACLEAGAPVTVAVETVADVSPPATAAPLRRVLAHLEVGRPPEEAWAELRQHPVWGPPARDLVRSARSGTGLVDGLRLHADDARRAARDAALRRARTVGVRAAVPLVACFLPAFVLVGVVPIIAGLLTGMLG